MPMARLKRKAEALCRRLREARRRGTHRPFFIELTGSPSSGKTTTKKILDTFFRRRGFRVAVPVEGAEAIRHISRKTHLYNVRTGLYALEHLIDHSVDQNFDLVIFDRCLFDAYTWMAYWHEKSEIDAVTAVTLQQFFMRSPWADMLDVAFVITAGAEAVESREREINLTDEDGETTNPESIARLARLFTATCEEFCAVRPIVHIDTSDLPKKEMALRVLAETVNRFTHRIF